MHAPSPIHGENALYFRLFCPCYDHSKFARFLLLELTSHTFRQIAMWYANEHTRTSLDYVMQLFQIFSATLARFHDFSVLIVPHKTSSFIFSTNNVIGYFNFNSNLFLRDLIPTHGSVLSKNTHYIRLSSASSTGIKK